MRSVASLVALRINTEAVFLSSPLNGGKDNPTHYDPVAISQG
jgi:hypothetical protein